MLAHPGPSGSPDQHGPGTCPELCQQCGADLPGPGQRQLSSPMVRTSLLEGS